MSDHFEDGSSGSGLVGTVDILGNSCREARHFRVCYHCVDDSCLNFFDPINVPSGWS